MRYYTVDYFSDKKMAQAGFVCIYQKFFRI